MRIRTVSLLITTVVAAAAWTVPAANPAAASPLLGPTTISRSVTVDYTAPTRTGSTMVCTSTRSTETRFVPGDGGFTRQVITTRTHARLVGTGARARCKVVTRTVTRSVWVATSTTTL